MDEVCGLWGNQWFIGWVGFNNGAKCLIGTIRSHLWWEIGAQVKKKIVEELLTYRQTKNNINEHWWTRASEPFMCEKAQSEIMTIEPACLLYMRCNGPGFCLCCWACAIGWLSQLNCQAFCIVCELITEIMVTLSVLFCREGFLFSRKLGRWKQNP